MIELIASIIGIIYLLLEYRASLWLWLFGFAMDALYAWLYIENQCYANAGLYLYYLAVCLLGAYRWLRLRRQDQPQVRSMSAWGWWQVAGSTAALTVLIVWLLHFTGESQHLLFDSLTSALSVVAMVLLAKGYYQQWVLWIIVNPLYVVFNLLIGLPWLALMFGVYSVVSVMGYRRWKKLSTFNSQLSTP